jgi:hypothetical protein
MVETRNQRAVIGGAPREPYAMMFNNIDDLSDDTVSKIGKNRQE